ncbi:hypothetical protein GW17_00010036 [Ensete ventricosum]|nr:hypothetical protein GW17_00010036 [Ensete ventricosum]RZR84245.1 hypothetical protein BHM03_00011013 [Ensete ventricosum]
MRKRQRCAPLLAALPTGGCPYGKRRCPRVAPHERAGTVPAGDTSTGTAPMSTIDVASPRILLNLQSSTLAATHPFGSRSLSATIVE